MRGLIIIPKFYEKLWGPTFQSTMSVMAPLWYEIQDRFGFDVRFADEVNVTSDVDIVLMWAVPYHNRPGLIPGLLDLNINTKLIMWSGDLQCYNNKECLENKRKVFERCDVIISQTNEYFIEMYPQYLQKNEIMLHFFSPHDRFTKLPFNTNPKMRCLMSGSRNGAVYVLREYIIRSCCKYVDYKPPIFEGNSYANLLHSYFCGVATASIFKYVLSKYFEIPATGSLLLAEETKDLKISGLIPYQHYIPITRENVFKRITECIVNPADYNDVRKNGMEFVRKHHSVLNRVDQLEEILNRLFR